MKVIGLDDREYKLDLSGKQILNNDRRPRSAPHLTCRQLLRELFPVSPILEEILLPSTGNLRLDFFLPQQMIALECQGEQHYKFVQHFHGNKQGFLKAQKNDRKKKYFCDINNIRLIYLRDSEDIETWKEIILNVHEV